MSPELTKAGTPRKRKPGGGRKPKGRHSILPRVDDKTASELAEIASAQNITIPELLSQIAGLLHEERP